MPRFFVVTISEGLLVFHSPFDDELDDYTPEFAVYFVPWSEAQRLHGSWSRLVTGTKRLGYVSAGDVEFDSTRRLMVSSRIVEHFAKRVTEPA